MPGIRGIEDDLGYTGLRGHVRQNGHKEPIMAKRAIWVLIETDENNLCECDKIHETSVKRILGNPDNYDIVDYCDESDLTVVKR